MVIIAPMLMLEWVLVLLLAAVVLTNLAERLAVPYPSLLAIAGAGLAFLPFAPQIRIEPELALALFVAPALLDAAFDTSPRGLRDNAIPVASMAIRRWRSGLADQLASRDPRGAIVLGWSGMRGLITLATAFAFPQQFPARDLIVLCAFCVVLGTLVIQGFTLLPLMRLLRFEDDGGIERELSRACVAVMQAALDSLDGETSPAATTVREQYAASRKVAEDRTSASCHQIRRTAATRDRRPTRGTAPLARAGEIGEEAFHRIQEELDWSELDAAPAGSFQSLAS